MTPRLIEIKQDRPGFDCFIGSWLCVGERNLLLDVGPAGSMPRLIHALKAMKINRIDFVLLTHIHIDHAGGLAEFLEVFPMARIICHKKGIRHLVEPEKLLAGSRKTLGDLVDMYGPIRPVERERFLSHEDAVVDGLRVIETPGHAAHHLSFLYGGWLFVGEAGGVYLKVGHEEYFRPATPPVFFLKEFLESIDRLHSLGDHPICFAHYGGAESSWRVLQRARDQLLRWESMIRDEIGKGDEGCVERAMERLFAEDQDLRPFHSMAPEDQERERFFTANSVKGFVEYLSPGKALVQDGRIVVAAKIFDPGL